MPEVLENAMAMTAGSAGEPRSWVCECAIARAVPPDALLWHRNDEEENLVVVGELAEYLGGTLYERWRGEAVGGGGETTLYAAHALIGWRTFSTRDDHPTLLEAQGELGRILEGWNGPGDVVAIPPAGWRKATIDGRGMGPWQEATGKDDALRAAARHGVCTQVVWQEGGREMLALLHGGTHERTKVLGGKGEWGTDLLMGYEALSPWEDAKEGFGRRIPGCGAVLLEPDGWPMAWLEVAGGEHEAKEAADHMGTSGDVVLAAWAEDGGHRVAAGLRREGYRSVWAEERTRMEDGKRQGDGAMIGRAWWSLRTGV